MFQERIKQEMAKKAALEDELETKTHQFESLEEINQQMISEMTKRMSAQIRDSTQVKEAITDLLEVPGTGSPNPDLKRSVSALSGVGANRSQSNVNVSARSSLKEKREEKRESKGSFFKGLFGGKKEAPADDESVQEAQRSPSFSDSRTFEDRVLDDRSQSSIGSARSRGGSAVPLGKNSRQRDARIRTASQKSDQGSALDLSMRSRRHSSIDLNSSFGAETAEYPASASVSNLEDMAVLKLQNKVMESNMHEMQQTMHRCLEEKYDEIKRKVFACAHAHGRPRARKCACAGACASGAGGSACWRLCFCWFLTPVFCGRLCTGLSPEIQQLHP